MITVKPTDIFLFEVFILRINCAYFWIGWRRGFRSPKNFRL